MKKALRASDTVLSRIEAYNTSNNVYNLRLLNAALYQLNTAVYAIKMCPVTFEELLISCLSDFGSLKLII